MSRESLVHKGDRQGLAAVNTEDERASVLHNNCYGKGLYISTNGYIDRLCNPDTHTEVRREGPRPQSRPSFECAWDGHGDITRAIIGKPCTSLSGYFPSSSSE